MAEFPPLPLEEWQDSKTTLHLFAQIVGKVRLALAPRVNHWWHIPFHLCGRGLTTRPMPFDDRSFELIFDLLAHKLVLQTSSGEVTFIPLQGLTVAQLYQRVMVALADVGVDVSIRAEPFDPSRAGSELPFAQDHEHGAYDPEAVARFWNVLSRIEPIFQQFRGEFSGKCSPVHFFWHSFDLAVTRFSGRPAELPADIDSVSREAYSHEVSSAGFWVGDSIVAEPAFYSYAAPAPEAIVEEPLRPTGAAWSTDYGSPMALYRYDDFRAAAVPRDSLLEFLRSSYEAASRLAAWPA